jgi:hypothetical protein
MLCKIPDAAVRNRPRRSIHNQQSRIGPTGKRLLGNQVPRQFVVVGVEIGHGVKDEGGRMKDELGDESLGRPIHSMLFSWESRDESRDSLSPFILPPSSFII